MHTRDTHELQIDFEIQGINSHDDEVPVRPRLPNVVSRRSHRIKIIGTIYDVPDPTAVTIVRLTDAVVNVFSNAVMGGKGDLARPSQEWGVSADDGEAEIRPVDLDPDDPPTVCIIVEPNTGDDHLGQGPDYEATFDVSSQTIPLVAGAAPKAGAATGAGAVTGGGAEVGTAATVGAQHTGTQTFNIPFSSK